MNKVENPREVIGGNKLITREYLEANFPKVIRAAEAYRKAKEAAPFAIEDDGDHEKIKELIKTGVGAADEVENLRVETKQPYLDAEREIQAFFMEHKTAILQDKAELEAKSTRWMRKKAAAEQARRDAEAAEARRKAEEAAAAAEKAREEANKAITAAVQNPANHAASVRYTNQAAAAETAATHAQHALALAQAAQSAPVSVISRGAGGTSSLGVKWTYLVEQDALIDLKMLRPYFPSDAIDKAIRGYIKAGQHLVPGTKTKLKDPDGKGGLPGIAIYDEGKGLHR